MFFARAHNLEHAECLLKEHLEGSADNELRREWLRDAT
jgi:hypothetical protein